MDSITHTSKNIYLYSGTYAASESSRPVASVVAFCASSRATARELQTLLRDYFDHVSAAEELFVVAPFYCKSQIVAMLAAQTLVERLEVLPFGRTRLIVVNEEGEWFEFDSAGDSIGKLPADVAHQLVQVGLRRLFASAGGLATTHGGYHFSKPSGRHSAQFIRTGDLLTRAPHVYFVAFGLLALITSLEYSLVLLDSSAIAPVGYAIADIRSRSGKDTLTIVDSFGGYEGLGSYGSVDPADSIVLISASTSGGLLNDVTEGLSVPPERQFLLFYIGEHARAGSVLCDLTAGEGRSVDQGYVPQISSEPAETCSGCANGQPVIELMGDGFMPATGTLTPRMITKVHGGHSLAPLMAALHGREAFRVRASDGARVPQIRSLLVTFAHLIEQGDEYIREAMLSVLRREFPSDIRSLVVLGDPESQALSRLVATEILTATGREPEVFSADALANPRHDRLPEGYSLVVAGVVAGGRQLRNLSRRLRALHEGQPLGYLIGLARPKTKAVWTELCSSLRFGPTRANEFDLGTVWYLETDPDRGEMDSWTAEQQVLPLIAEKLSGNSWSAGPEVLSARLTELADIGLPSSAENDSIRLFLQPSSDHSYEMKLNPHFAFWEFEYSKASDAEVFFTISTVLHNARYSGDGKYAFFGEGGSRYVLSPVNFHRFNDAIIQSSILRAARGSELDYRFDSVLSEYVCDMIGDMVANWDTEQGLASAEFLLSLAGGLSGVAGCFLRVRTSDLTIMHERLQEPAKSYPPVLGTLLAYIGAVLSSGSPAELEGREDLLDVP